jgi:colicin import membrane protein
VGELRQESLMFSLQALEEMEQERVRTEQAERLARAEAEQAALWEEERLRREAEARRARAELERERIEHLRRKEEHARIEAMQQALVERARIEVEWQGRAEIDARQREHEARLAALDGKTRRQRLRWLGALFAALVVATGTWGASMLRRLQHAERVSRAQQETLDLERQNRRHAARLLELSERRAATIAAELDAARADTSRAAAAPTSEPRPAGAASRPRPVPSARPQAAQARPCRNDGDPLDNCLPRR